MRLRLAFALAASLFLSAVARADRGGYRIASFDVGLAVQPNAELLVEERLAVDFSEPRHGIYRTIPIHYTDPRGYLYSLEVRFREAVDETGAAHQAELTREGRYLKIRIGDPDRTVQGRVVYVLRYLVRGALVHFPEHDELYWNATGNEWQADIEAASARVTLPGPVAPDALETAVYTGGFGSRETNAAVDVSGSTITYRTTRPLAPLQGLTVAAAWPHGLVRFPGPLRKALRFFADNWVVLLPFVALAGIGRRYWTSGRDPSGPASIVVRYEPPADLRPGEIGALLDERVDLRDLTATVVDLAVRGFLRIRVDEKEQLFGLWSTQETWFERTDRPAADLRDYERRVLDGLFASGKVVSAEDLEEKFYKRIPAIRDALWDDLSERGYVASNPRGVRRNWMLLGAGAGALTLALGVVWANHRGAAMPHALLFPAASGIAVLAVFLAFARAMPRRTRKGVQFRAWAFGFEEFVDRVERDRLEAAERRNAFEALLPYAMALGVASTWARRFEGIYRTSPPSWFRGPSAPASFSTPRFERTLSSAMSRAGRGMAATPRASGSSGSGGGGFSGGGGGGGGGGSW